MADLTQPSPSFGSDNNFRFNLFSPFVGGDPILNGYRPHNAHDDIMSGAKAASQTQGSYIGEAVKSVNVAGKIMTRDQLHNINGGDDLLYYVDKLASGSERGALDTFRESFSDPWRFVPYVSTLASVGGSIVSAVKASEAMEKMTKSGSDPDALTDEERVSLATYMNQSNWEGKSTAMSKVADIVTAMPAFAAEMGSSSAISKAVMPKLYKAFAPKIAARSLAADGAARNMARSSARTAIDAIDTIAHNSSKPANKLFGTNVNAAVDALKGLVKGHEDTPWGKKVLADIASKEFASKLLDKGNYTPYARKLVRKFAARAALDTKAANMAGGLLNDPSFQGKIAESIAGKSAETLKGLLEPLVKQANSAQGKKVLGESLAKVLTAVDDGNVPLAHSLSRSFLMEAADYGQDLTTRAAVQSYAGRYVDLAMNLGQKGPIRQKLLHAAGWARDHVLRGLFEHYDTMDMIGLSTRGELRNALGIMLIEAPLKGALYTAINAAVRLPVSLMLTGRPMAPLKGELDVRAQAMLTQDEDLMNRAFMIGLGQQWVEMASENVGSAFSAVGRKLLGAKFGAKVSLADRLKAYTSRSNLMDKYTQFDGKKAMSFRRWLTAFTGEESYNSLKAEQLRRVAVNRVLKNEAVARKIFGDNVPTLEQIWANPALKRKAVDAGRDFLQCNAAAMLIAADRLTKAANKAWYDPGKLLSPAFIRKAMKFGHFDGTVEEWLEERYGGFLNHFWELDPNAEEDKAKKGLFSSYVSAILSAETLVPELIAFMIPGVMTNALSRAQAAIGTGALSKYQALMGRLEDLHNHGMAVIDGFDSNEEMAQIMSAARQQVQQAKSNKGIDEAASTAHRFIQQGEIIEGDQAVGTLIDHSQDEFEGVNAQRPVSQEEINNLRQEIFDACREYQELMRDTRWNTAPNWWVTTLHKAVGLLTFAATGQYAALRWNPIQAMTQTWSDGRDILIQGAKLFEEAHKEARMSYSRTQEARELAGQSGAAEAAAEGYELLSDEENQEEGTVNARTAGAQAIADRFYEANRDKVDNLAMDIARDKINQMLNRRFTAQGALRMSMNGSIQEAAESLADQRIAIAKDLLTQGITKYDYINEIGVKMTFDIPTTEAGERELHDKLVKANRINLAARYLALAATGKVTYESARDTYNTRIGALIMTADAATDPNVDSDVVIYRRHLDAAIAASPELRDAEKIMTCESLDDPIADRLSDFGSSVNVSDIRQASQLTEDELFNMSEETARTDERFIALSRFAHQMKYVHGENPWAMRHAMRQALKVSKMLSTRYSAQDKSEAPRWVKTLPSGKRDIIIRPDTPEQLDNRETSTAEGVEQPAPAKKEITFYDQDSSTPTTMEFEYRTVGEEGQWVRVADGVETTLENILNDAGYTPVRTQFIFAPCNTVTFHDPLIATWNCYSLREKLTAHFSNGQLPFSLGDLFKDQATLTAYHNLVETYRDMVAKAPASVAETRPEAEAEPLTFEFLGNTIDESTAKSLVEGYEAVEAKAVELAHTLQSRSGIFSDNLNEYVVHVAAMSDSERVVIPFDPGTHGSAPSAITAAVIRNRLLSYYDPNFGGVRGEQITSAYNLTDVTLSFRQAAYEARKDAQEIVNNYEAAIKSGRAINEISESDYNEAQVTLKNLEGFINTYLRREGVNEDFLAHFLTNVVFLYGPHARNTGNWLAHQAMWGHVAERWLRTTANYKHLLRMQLFANVLLNPAADVLPRDQVIERLKGSYNVGVEDGTGFLQSELFRTYAADVPNAFAYYKKLFNDAQNRERAARGEAAQKVQQAQQGQNESKPQEELLTADQIAQVELDTLGNIVSQLSLVNDGNVSLTYALLTARRSDVKGGDVQQDKSGKEPVTEKKAGPNEFNQTDEGNEDLTSFNQLPLESRVSVANVVWEVCGGNAANLTMENLLQYSPHLAAALSDNEDANDLKTVKELNNILSPNGGRFIKLVNLVFGEQSKMKETDTDSRAALKATVTKQLEEIAKAWADCRQPDSLADLFKYFMGADFLAVDSKKDTRARKQAAKYIYSILKGDEVSDTIDEDLEETEDDVEDERDDAGADNTKDAGFDATALQELEGMPEWKTLQFMMQSLFPTTRNNMAEAVKALIREIDTFSPNSEEQKAVVDYYVAKTLADAEVEYRRKHPGASEENIRRHLTALRPSLATSATVRGKAAYNALTSFRDTVLLAGDKWAQSDFIVARNDTVASNPMVRAVVDLGGEYPLVNVLFTFLGQLRPERYNKIISAMANIVPVAGVSTEVDRGGNITLDDEAGGNLTTAPHLTFRTLAAELLAAAKRKAFAPIPEPTAKDTSKLRGVLQDAGLLPASKTLSRAFDVLEKKLPFSTGIAAEFIRNGKPLGSNLAAAKPIITAFNNIINLVNELASDPTISLDRIVEALLVEGSQRAALSADASEQDGNAALAGPIQHILNAYAATIQPGRRTLNNATTELNKGATSIAQQDFLKFASTSKGLMSLLGSEPAEINRNVRFCQWADGSSIFTHVVSGDTMGADFIVHGIRTIQQIGNLIGLKGRTINNIWGDVLQSDNAEIGKKVIHIQMYTGDRSTLSTMRIPAKAFAHFVEEAIGKEEFEVAPTGSDRFADVTTAEGVYYHVAKYILTKMGLKQIEPKRTQIVAAEQIQTSLYWKDTTTTTNENGEQVTTVGWKPPKMLCVLSPDGSNETLFGSGGLYTHFGVDPLLATEPDGANTTKVHLVGKHGRPGDSVYEMVKGNYLVLSATDPDAYTSEAHRYLHHFVRNYCEKNHVGRAILTDYDGIKVGPLAWKNAKITIAPVKQAKPAEGEKRPSEGNGIDQLTDVEKRKYEAFARALTTSKVTVKPEDLLAPFDYGGKIGTFIQKLVAEFDAMNMSVEDINNELLSRIKIDGQALDKAIPGFQIVPTAIELKGSEKKDSKDAPWRGAVATRQKFAISYDALDYRALRAANLYHEATPESHPLAKNICNDILATVATGDVLGGRDGDLFALLAADFPRAMTKLALRQGNREALLKGNDEQAKNLAIGGNDYSTARDAELMFNAIMTKMAKPSAKRLKVMLVSPHAKLTGFGGEYDANWTRDDAFYNASQDDEHLGLLRMNIRDKRARYGSFLHYADLASLQENRKISNLLRYISFHMNFSDETVKDLNLKPFGMHDVNHVWDDSFTLTRLDTDAAQSVVTLLAALDGVTAKDLPEEEVGGKASADASSAFTDKANAVFSTYSARGVLATLKKELLQYVTDCYGDKMSIDTYGQTLWGDALGFHGSDYTTDESGEEFLEDFSADVAVRSLTVDDETKPLRYAGSRKDIGYGNAPAFYIAGTVMPFPRTPSGNAGPVFTSLRLSTPATVEKVRGGYVPGKDSIAIPPPDAELRQGSDNDGDTAMVTLPFFGNRILYTPDDVLEAAKELRTALNDPATLETMLKTDENGALRLDPAVAQKFGAILSAAFNLISASKWSKQGAANPLPGINTEQWAVGTLDDNTRDEIPMLDALRQNGKDLTDVRTIAVITHSGKNASTARGSIVAGVASIHTAAIYQFVPESLVDATRVDESGKHIPDWSTYRGFTGLCQYLDQYSNTLFDDLKEQLSWKMRLTPQTTDAFLGLILSSVHNKEHLLKTTLANGEQGPEKGYRGLCRDALIQFVEWVDGAKGAKDRGAFKGVFGDAMMCALGLARTSEHLSAFVSGNLTEALTAEDVAYLARLGRISRSQRVWANLVSALEAEGNDALRAVASKILGVKQEELTDGSQRLNDFRKSADELYSALQEAVKGTTVQDVMKSTFVRAAALAYLAEKPSSRKPASLEDVVKLARAVDVMGSVHRFSAATNPYKASIRSARVVTAAGDISVVASDGVIVAQPEVRSPDGALLVPQRNLGRLANYHVTADKTHPVSVAQEAVRAIAGRGTIDQTLIEDVLAYATEEEEADINDADVIDGLRMAPPACAAHEWVKKFDKSGTLHERFISYASYTNDQNASATELFLRGVEGAFLEAARRLNRVSDKKVADALRTLVAFINTPIKTGTRPSSHYRLSPSMTNLTPGALGRIHRAIITLLTSETDFEIGGDFAASSVASMHGLTTDTTKPALQPFTLKDLVAALVEYSAITSRTRAISDAGASSLLDLYPLGIRKEILAASGSNFTNMIKFFDTHRNDKAKPSADLLRFIKRILSVKNRKILANETRTPFVNMDDVLGEAHASASTGPALSEKAATAAAAAFNGWGKNGQGQSVYEFGNSGVSVVVDTTSPQVPAEGRTDSVIYTGSISWTRDDYFPEYVKQFGKNSIPVATVIEPPTEGANDPSMPHVYFTFGVRINNESFPAIASSLDGFVTHPEHPGVLMCSATTVQELMKKFASLKKKLQEQYKLLLSEARKSALNEAKEAKVTSPLADNQPQQKTQPLSVSPNGTVTSSERTQAITNVLTRLFENSDKFIDKAVAIVESRVVDSGQWNQRVLNEILSPNDAPMSAEDQASELRKIRDVDLTLESGGRLHDHWDNSIDGETRGISAVIAESVKFAKDFLRDYCGVKEDELNADHIKLIEGAVRSAWLAGVGMKAAWRHASGLELTMKAQWPSSQVVNLYFLEALSPQVPAGTDARDSVLKYHRLSGRDVAKKLAMARSKLAAVMDKILRDNPPNQLKIIDNSAGSTQRYDSSTYIEPVTYTIAKVIRDELNYFASAGGQKEGDRKYAFQNMVTLMNLVSLDKTTPVAGIRTVDESDDYTPAEYIENISYIRAAGEDSGSASRVGDVLNSVVNPVLRSHDKDPLVHRVRADGKAMTWDPFTAFGGGQVSHWRQSFLEGATRDNGDPLVGVADPKAFLYRPQTLALAALLSRVTPYALGAYGRGQSGYDAASKGQYLVLNTLRRLTQDQALAEAVAAVRDAFNSLCAYRGVINFTLEGPGSTGVSRVTEDMLEETMEWTPPTEDPLAKLLSMRDMTVVNMNEEQTDNLVKFVGRQYMLESVVEDRYSDPDDNTSMTLLEVDPSAAFQSFTLPKIGHTDLRETMMYQTGQDAVIEVMDKARFLSQLFGTQDDNNRIPHIVVEDAKGIVYKDGTFRRSDEASQRVKFIAPETVRFKFTGERFTNEEKDIVTCYTRALCAYVLGGSDYLYTGVGNASRFGYPLALTHQMLRKEGAKDEFMTREEFIARFSRDEIIKEHTTSTAGSGGTSSFSVWLHGLYRSLPVELVDEGFFEDLLGSVYDAATEADRRFIDALNRRATSGRGELSNSARAEQITRAVHRALLDKDLIRISDARDNKGRIMTSVVVPVATVRDKFMQSEAYQKLLAAGRTPEMLDFDYVKKFVGPAVKRLAMFRNMNPEVFNSENAILSGMGSNFWLSDGMGMFSKARTIDDVLSQDRAGDDKDLDRNEMRSLATTIAIKGHEKLFSTVHVDDANRQVVTLNTARVNHTLVMLFNDMFPHRGRGNLTARRMTFEEVWRTGLLARNDVELNNAKSPGVPPMITADELRARIETATISDLAVMLYAALQERRDRGGSLSDKARIFTKAYEMSDIPFNTRGPVRIGNTMDEAFRRNGELPSDAGIDAMLMNMGKHVATACAFTGTLHTMVMTSNMYGRPNYILVPNESPTPGEHFSDRFWGDLAMWYQANFPGLPVTYNGALSGRENCRRIASAALKRIQASEAGMYSQMTDYKDVPGSGSLTGVESIYCINPTYTKADGTREMDDQHSTLTGAGGGEAMCYMRTLCGLRYVTHNPQSKFKFLDQIMAWSKSLAVSGSLFFRVATGFESPVAASGFLQSVLGGAANVFATTGQGAVQNALNEWMHDMADNNQEFANLLNDSKNSSFLSLLFGNKSDKKVPNDGYNALSITDVMRAWESNDPGLIQLKRLCVRCGITLSHPGEFDVFGDKTEDVREASDKAAKMLAKVVAMYDPKVAEKMTPFVSGFLRGISADARERNFTHLMNITKLAVASQLLARLRNWAIMENRYFDPVRELRKLGNYINEEIGGVNPLAHAFATPKATRWLNYLMFSWQWTMGSWSAAGGTMLSNALLGGEATNPALRGFFLGRWARMYGWVARGLPFFSQIALMAMTRALYALIADDDDKEKYRPDLDRWFNFMNEERGKDAIDITPLLNISALIDEKYFGGAIRRAKRGESGALARVLSAPIPIRADLSKPYDRRTYMHFAKQLTEVVRWGDFQEALEQSFSKMSLPLQAIITQAAGRHPLTGFETDWRAEKRTGLNAFLGAASDILFNTFAPFSISGHLNFPEAGALVLLGPTKRGLGEWMATNELATELTNFAREASTVRGYRSKSLLRTRANVDRILADAARNGLDPDELLKATRAQVLGKAYTQFWNNLPRDPDAKPNAAVLEALSMMRALGAEQNGVKKSLEGRIRRGGTHADKNADPAYQWGMRASKDYLGPSVNLLSDKGYLRQNAKGGNVFDDAGLPPTIFGVPVDAPQRDSETPTTVFGMPVHNRKAPSQVDPRKALASDRLPQAIFGNPVEMTEHQYFDQDPRVPGFYELGEPETSLP